MKNIFDECLTVEQYAQQLGVSKRTMHRYINMGMPRISGVRQCIHVPTANDWWLSLAQPLSIAQERQND